MNKSASPLSTQEQTSAKTSHNNAKLPEYKSNPFAISYQGFQLLVQYAKGVFIALVVLGILGFTGNIVDIFNDSSNLENRNEQSYSEDFGSSFDNEYTSFNSGTDSFAQNSIDDTAYDDELGDEEGLHPPDASTILYMVGFAIVVIIIVLVVAVTFGAAISAIFGGTIAAGAVAASNEEFITLGQALSKMGSRFGELYKAYVFIFFKVLGGLLLLIIPGIRAQLRYEAVPYILMQNPTLKAKDAMKEAKMLYKGHLMEMFGIISVEGLIPIIGGAFGAGGRALSYKQLKAYGNANAQTPGPHWLNFLPFIAIILFGVLGFIAALVLYTIF